MNMLIIMYIDMYVYADCFEFHKIYFISPYKCKALF